MGTKRMKTAVSYPQEMCKFYTTTGYPQFKAKCLKGLWASLKCHSNNEKCSEYKPSEMPNGRS